MNKLLYSVMTVVLVVIAILVCNQLFFQTEYQSVSFQASDEKLSNPSCGFYRQVDTGELENLKKLKDHERLVLAAFDLAAYRDQTLPEEKLEELERFCTAVRDSGAKMIFRAAYGFTSDAALNDASSLSIIEEHISQIAPVLNQNKDIILCVQAGFLGPWGEWHSSLLLENQPDDIQKQVRNAVLNRLLNELHPELILNLRRPSFIRDAQEAGLDISRMGFHNDGLLSTESDYGTYTDKSRNEELIWCKENILTGINGGEMSKASDWSTVQNADKEFADLKLSYLNAYYNKDVLEAWRQEIFADQNGFDYMERRLGYRLRLEQINLPQKLAVGADTMKLELTFVNDGFAPIEKGYVADLLVLVEGQEIVSYPLVTDVSGLASSANTAQIKMKLTKPMRQQGFQLALKIYDNDPMLIEDTKYHVRLANQGILYDHGQNDLLYVEFDGRVLNVSDGF